MYACLWGRRLCICGRGGGKSAEIDRGQDTTGICAYVHSPVSACIHEHMYAGLLVLCMDLLPQARCRCVRVWLCSIIRMPAKATNVGSTSLCPRTGFHQFIPPTERPASRTLATVPNIKAALLGSRTRVLEVEPAILAAALKASALKQCTEPMQ